MSVIRWRRGLGLAALLAAFWAPQIATGGPPGMPDPRQMSGIPRADPAVPAGTLTVRCLLGTFAQPAVGVTVSLRTADTGQEVRREAVADAAGRATFEGLDPLEGRRVVVSATLEGETQESLPITLGGQMGSRVMLVKGASAGAQPGGAGEGSAGEQAARAAAAPPAGHGNSDALNFREGVPFALPVDAANGRVAGTLVVGVIEPNPGAPQPQEGLAVTVRITPRTGEPQVRTGTTDADGKAIFTGLVAPEVPAGASVQVEVVMAAGEPPRTSEPFQMGETPLALVFTPSRVLERAGVAPTPPPAPALVRARGPKPDGTLPPGVLAVQVIGADGQPVDGLEVAVERRDMTGQTRRWSARTEAGGAARFEDLPTGEDGFYTVVATRDDAPFSTGFFEMIPAMGVRTQVQTFAVTRDRGKVKSAVQVEVRPLEKNESQVIQIYEVFIDGDEAYWPGTEGRITGADRAHGLQVMPQAERWLDAREGAPFALLARPLVPGEVIQLSTAYLLPHDGEVDYQWRAPFPVVQATAVLAPEFSVVEGAMGPGKAPPHDRGQAATVQLFDLAVPSWSPGLCDDGADGCDPEAWTQTGAAISMKVASLPTKPAWVHQVALAMIAGFLGLVAGGLMLRRRVDPRAALEAQRRSLLEAIARLDADGGRNAEGTSGGPSRQSLVTALDEVCRKLDSLGVGRHNQPA